MSYRIYSLVTFTLAISLLCSRSYGFLPSKSNSRKFTETKLKMTLSNSNQFKIDPAVKVFGAFLGFALAMCPAVNAVELKSFSNDRYHTSFSYPSSWEAKRATISGDRVVEAFVDPMDADTSASIVISPIPADYTKLDSFGGKDNLRNYVLPSGEGVSTNVILEKVVGNAYYLEYTISAPDSITRHVQSVFALRPQESVVGLTIQTSEENY